MFKGKTILITGGTGSFGSNYAKYLLTNYDLKKLIIFSRDERKQVQLEQEIGDPRVRYFLGDVRDIARLQRAFNGVDIVIHAAALKQVPTLEYNPFEAVKTNILGSQNVIEAAIDQKVKKVLLVSTDKAAQPINLYGSTKLCAEKLFIDGNSYTPDGQTILSCVRYGNVLGSRGSIVETLLKSKNAGVNQVSITDETMTRFWITLPQAFDLVTYALEHMVGGEVFIPQIPSMKLVDLFEVLVPGASRKVIGIRAGEKIHEMLLTSDEARRAVEVEKYFIVLPEQGKTFDVEKRFAAHLKGGRPVRAGFSFTSDTNDQWLTHEQLQALLNEVEQYIR